MAIDFHDRKLKRTVLDREEKEALGEEIPDRYVENWQQFKSELHQTMTDKSRDWDRVAYTELTDAQKQGQAMRLLEDGNVDKLVYKVPLPTACAQCKHLYLMPDGETPRLFKLSELINNGTNHNRKPHPIKGGKVKAGGRGDGQETLKAVAGTIHPWCQCGECTASCITSAKLFPDSTASMNRPIRNALRTKCISVATVPMNVSGVTVCDTSPICCHRYRRSAGG